jgi:hypothetical protein
LIVAAKSSALVELQSLACAVILLPGSLAGGLKSFQSHSRVVVSALTKLRFLMESNLLFLIRLFSWQSEVSA